MLSSGVFSYNGCAAVVLGGLESGVEVGQPVDPASKGDVVKCGSSHYVGGAGDVFRSVQDLRLVFWSGSEVVVGRKMSTGAIKIGRECVAWGGWRGIRLEVRWCVCVVCVISVYREEGDVGQSDFLEPCCR